MNARSAVSIVLLALSASLCGEEPVSRQAIARAARASLERGGYVFKLSPSGRYVFFSREKDGRRDVHVRDLDGDAVVNATAALPGILEGCLWKSLGGQDRLVCLHKADGRSRVTHLAPDGSDPKDATPDDGEIRLLHEMKGDPRRILIAAGARRDAFRLDLETGRAEPAAENTRGWEMFVPDHDGRVRLALSKKEGLWHRKTEREPFERVRWGEGATVFRPLLFFTPDDVRLYAFSNRKTDRAALVTLDPATGEEETVYEHPVYDLVHEEHFIRSSRTKTIAGGTLRHAQGGFFLDDGWGKTHAAIEKRLPDAALTFLDASADERRVLFVARSEKRGLAHFCFDVVSGRLTPLHETGDEPDPARLADVRTVRFPASDGFWLHGQLAVPAGRKPGERVPALILAHPEPWRESPDPYGGGYRHQLFAARGYAVLKLEHRGCWALGKAYQRAAHGEFAGKMLTDFADAAQWLIDQGITAPGRIGIMGPYWGGFAAVANAAHRPDLFACAVCVGGGPDLVALSRTLVPYYKYFGGLSPQEAGEIAKEEALEAASPAHMDRERVIRPLLFVSGRANPFTDVEATERFVKEVREAGGTAEHLVLDGKSNDFTPEENRRKGAAIEAFLERHLERPIPVDAFVRLGAVETAQTGFRLSPSGAFVSYVDRTPDSVRLMIRPVGAGGGEPRDLAAALGEGIGDCAWYEKDGKDRLACFCADGATGARVRSVDPDTLAVTEVVRSEEALRLSGRDSVDPTRFLLRRGQRGDLARLDMASGAIETLFENAPGYTRLIPDPAGELRLAATADGRLMHRPDARAPFREVPLARPGDSVTPLLDFTPDAKRVHAFSNRGRDRIALVTLDLATGEETPVYEHPSLDFIRDRPVRSRRKGIVGVTFSTEPGGVFFDGHWKTVHAFVAETFPDEAVEYIDADRDETRHLVGTVSAKNGVSVHLVDMAKRTATLLARRGAWPEGIACPDRRTVFFEAADGTRLHATLFLPAGHRKGVRLPAIVMTHEIPWRETPLAVMAAGNFHFLASRGYAVLYVDHRGCAGLGRAYRKAAEGELAGKVMSDYQIGRAHV